MKKFAFILIPLFTLLIQFPTFAQEKEESPVIKKETTHEFFGNKVRIITDADGNKTWIFSDMDDERIQQKMNRSVKYDSGLDFEIGINTWTGGDGAPRIRAWGSWNPAINTYFTYSPNRNFNIKSSLGVSWYNFKFEDNNLQALRSPDGVIFENFEPGTGIKSKISASYLNLTLIPSVQTNNGMLRFGIGPYVGYRLGGRGKFVYRNESGNRSRDIQNANMFANDFRYGGRIEIGVADVDLYFNYDFNEFFQTDKGPRVNAISFGIIL